MLFDGDSYQEYDCQTASYNDEACEATSAQSNAGVARRDLRSSTQYQRLNEWLVNLNWLIKYIQSRYVIINN